MWFWHKQCTDWSLQFVISWIVLNLELSGSTRICIFSWPVCICFKQRENNRNSAGNRSNSNNQTLHAFQRKGERKSCSIAWMFLQLTNFQPVWLKQAEFISSITLINRHFRLVRNPAPNWSISPFHPSIVTRRGSFVHRRVNCMGTT